MPDNSPFYSVIMNVYNGEQHLPHTLESLFNQTFEDWELIFWDDASTDNSSSCIQRFDDPRIRYFRAESQIPLSRAREEAIKEANGIWLAFLDQDDLWSPDKLETQYTLSQAEGVALTYTGTVDFDDDHNTFEHDWWHNPSALPSGKILEELFLNGDYISMSSLTMRRDVVLSLMPFPHELDLITDYYLNTNIANGHLTASTGKYCCWYRIHPGSTTNKNIERMLRQTLDFTQQWKRQLPQRIFERRISIQKTLLAYQLLKSGKRLTEAFRLLCSIGSASYLLSRPFAKLKRKTRRPKLPKPPQFENRTSSPALRG